jgi:hypothetical protein
MDPALSTYMHLLYATCLVSVLICMQTMLTKLQNWLALSKQEMREERAACILTCPETVLPMWMQQTARILGRAPLERDVTVLVCLVDPPGHWQILLINMK